MEINKYPYSHKAAVDGDIVDAATQQAENDNYNVLLSIKNNFDNLKVTSDIFGNGIITDKAQDTNLDSLPYKNAYRNSDSVQHTFSDTLSNPNASFILQPGDLIYYVGTAGSNRKYLQVKQPYQITYAPFIDKNGEITFIKNLESNFEPQIVKGPMSNAIWNFYQLIDTVRVENTKYLEIPVSSIFWLKDNTIKMLPWDNYSIIFFDQFGEQININYKDETLVNNVYYSKISGGVRIYYIRILLDIPTLTGADNFIIRIY